MFIRRTPRFINLLRRTMTDMEVEIEQKNIIEGQAEITLQAKHVFYNPVQEFNRDLSIAVLTMFTEDYIKEKKAAQAKKNDSTDKSENSDDSKIEFNLLEALAATGLRSIRYAKEVPNLTKVIANDLSKDAVDTMKINFKSNNVDHLVETSHGDACMLMYNHKHPSQRFAAIDLDPYGCPSTFLDSAVQSVQDGGLLLVTATDMAVLAGNAPETCFTKYGSISLKTRCCHEMALRILLRCIEQHANQYSRYIVPLLSISADFYVRVFVKIYSGAVHCKKTTSKLSMVYQCVGCDNLTLQPLGGFKPNPSEKNPKQEKAFLPTAPTVGANCEHCNQKHHMGGPIWSAPIHDEAFVTRLLSWVTSQGDRLGTHSRVLGVLCVVREELLCAPLYYTLDKMLGRVHLTQIPMLTFRSAILNAGYKVSYSHASKQSVKTNAPAKLLWDIIRTWAQFNPVKPARLESDPIAKHILSQEITYPVDMNLREDANPISRREGLLRFQFNPTAFWGPGSRNVVNDSKSKMSRSYRNQNKYTKHKRQHSNEEDDTRKKPASGNEDTDV